MENITHEKKIIHDGKRRGLEYTILLFTIFICVAVAYYINFVIDVEIAYTDILSVNNIDALLNFFSLKVIYTNLFYIPVILAAMWYRKKVVHFALFLGLVHIYVTYCSLGFFFVGTAERAAVLVIIAYAIALISEKRATAEEKLKDAYNKLRETQDQLIQHEKMAAMGQLASGFAHQIRNPLEIILMGAEFLSNTLPEKDEKCEKSIEKIKQATNRANTIITDILKFSRTSELKFELVNVCRLLDETIHLIENRTNLNRIKIKRNYPGELIEVKADKNMLQQAFLNLFMNALDVMPEGGEIRIKVYNEIVSQIDKKSGRRPSDYFRIGDKRAVVEIEDTGKGIFKDVLPKVFNPFFTTREPGKGTGLGLSMVDLILERHQGTVDVESEVNKGTKFTIKLQTAKNSIKRG